MIKSTGKKISPLRFFQYSSALDTHDYNSKKTPEPDLIKLHNQIKKKDEEITRLKEELYYFTPEKKSFLDKSPKNPQITNCKNLPGPIIQPHTIKFPNPKFNGFNPITGEDKYSHRSLSPFQNVGKRCIDKNYISRPIL